MKIKNSISDTECRKLFVYGTLRRGGRFHHLLWRRRGVDFAAEARIRGRLYDLGNFPGAVETEDRWSYVQGELYELTYPDELLPQIDDFEGYSPPDPDGSLFVRKLTEAFLADGQSVKAWTYFYSGDVSRSRIIPSGIYSGR